MNQETPSKPHQQKSKLAQKQERQAKALRHNLQRRKATADDHSKEKDNG